MNRFFRGYRFNALLLLCLIQAGYSFSQNVVADSLLPLLKKYNANATNTCLKDTTRIFILNRLSQEYTYTRDYSTAMKYARIAQNISEKLVRSIKSIKAKECLANSIRSVAQIYVNREDFNNALKQFNKELVLREEIGEKRATALCLNKIGVMYNFEDDLSQSIEYFFKALKIMEETGDQIQIANIYNSLGIAFGRQHNNSKALEYYRKELEIGKKLNDASTIATAHSNIGTVLAEQGKYEEAIGEFNLFMESAVKSNDQYSIGLALLNMGDIYTRKGEYQKALETNSKGLNIFEELGTKYEAGLIYYNQGNTYLSMARLKQGNIKRNLSEAQKNINKALTFFEKGGLIEDMSFCYLAFSTLDSCLGNNKGALENYKKYILLRDSLLNQISTAKSVRAEMNYEFDKKEAISNLEQEKKDAVAIQENARQKSIRNLFIVAFTFMLILAIFIFRSYYQKRKINDLISSQKLEVEKQKWIVEKNQKQIIDSINYAKRIQSSMLPHESALKKAFPESFILYQPKDIVSGDFYWLYSIPGTSQSVIVLADCTGHGVPGAFLSMVGATLLNEIVCHKNISDPAGILRALNSGLTSTLVSKKEETHSDGMDISILKLDSAANKLFFAGANQTLYIVNNGMIEKVEPQVYSIDGAFDLEDNPDFVSIEKNIRTSTSIFMSTDGFADQTGESTRKKFLSSRFEQLLLEIHPLPAGQQLSVLQQTFNDWKGSQKQIDDILVIGIKV